MKNKLGKISWMLLATLFGVVAFILFKFWLTDDSVPVYASNIAAAFFGTIITVAITAVLLKQQTEIETTKEFNIKITEAKIELYTDLMNALENALTSEKVSRNDAMRMAILSRKIVFVGSMGVLEALDKLTRKYSRSVKDKRLDSVEQEELLDRLGAVSIEIRKDIISGTTKEEEIALTKFMKNSIGVISGRNIGTTDYTLNSKEEADFKKLISLLSNSKIEIVPGKVGYSVRDSKGKSIANIFPEVSSKKSVFILKGLSDDKLRILNSHKIELGVSQVDSQSSIQIPPTMSVVNIHNILKELQ